MSLIGKRVLVCGGNGTVGGGAAYAFVKSGATVIIPSRASKEKIISNFNQDLKDEELNRVIAIPEVDISTEEGAEKVKSIILEQHKGIDHLVTSLGGWWQKGPTTTVSLKDIRDAIHDLAISHFLAAKTFLPLIFDKDDSSYTIVTGAAGEQVFHPAAGLTTIGASTLFGLALSLMAETRDKKVKVNELRISVRIQPENLSGGHIISNKVAGSVFPKLALSNHKGKTIRLDSLDDITKFN